ncbi:venom protease-like [Lycorma delicatula]|uniref:venom protease-like n=1 Tax=Lycorma delicatula TaxID=130591 RepID=UPI003F510014
MFLKGYIILLLFSYTNWTNIYAQNVKFQYEGEECGLKGRGICKNIRFCQIAKEMIKRGEKPANCGFENMKDPLVCCYDSVQIKAKPEQNQTKPISSQSISETKCMEYQKTSCNVKRVRRKQSNLLEPSYAVGGVPVNPKELPFMGLVGYGTKNNVDWACGCSLISERFVLSAAHCTKDPNGGLARWVRLGELDLSRKNEIANPIDFEIIRRINHPDYRSELIYNDIALYQLNCSVTFTDTIKPICLPQPNSYYDVTNVIGAGWGRIDYAGPRSTILLKVDLDYLTVRDCKNTAELRVAPRGLDEETMICAGVLEGGRDTCSGDSGGPLFLPRKSDQLPCFLQTQLGITSFGKQCALKGFPAIYTRVLNYVPWIESIVWPEYQSDPGLVWSS